MRVEAADRGRALRAPPARMTMKESHALQYASAPFPARPPAQGPGLIVDDVTREESAPAYNEPVNMHTGAKGCGLATAGFHNRGGAADDRQTGQPDPRTKEA